MRSIISIPGSLSFAKLVMMSSVPTKSAGDARYASQDPLIESLNQRCFIQSRLQSVLGVRSFYVERTKLIKRAVIVRPRRQKRGLVFVRRGKNSKSESGSTESLVLEGISNFRGGGRVEGEVGGLYCR